MSTIHERLEAQTTLLDTKAAAAMLDYHPKYIYELARAGEIPCYRIKGTVRFDGGELSQWLRGKHCPAKAKRWD